MAQIPQYDRRVGIQNTPFGYIDGNAPQSAFGMDVAQAGQKLSDAGKNTLGVIENLKYKYDTTKLEEFKNKLYQYSMEKIEDKDNGYLYKVGKDAMGKSPEVMQELDKYTQELRDKYKFRGDFAIRADAIQLGHKRETEFRVEEHDKKQSDFWQDQVMEQSTSLAINRAAIDFNDDQALLKQREMGKIAVKNNAISKGYNNNEEYINNQIRRFEADFAKTAISSCISSDNYDRAEKLLNAYKDNIGADGVVQYTHLINENKKLYNARVFAESLVGLSTEEAFKQIDSIKDIRTRDLTEREYNRKLSHEAEIQRQYDIKVSNEIMQQVFKAYETGGSISSIKQKVNSSDMSFEQKVKMHNNIDKMEEMQAGGNNNLDYNILLDLAAVDLEEFVKINPADYCLTKEQYQKVAEMQRKAINREVVPEAELRKEIKELASGVGFMSGKPISKGDVENVVFDFMIQLEKMGLKINLKNDEDVKKFMNYMNYKVPKEEREAKKIPETLDETKELLVRAAYRGKEYKVAERAAKEYMYFKGQNKREPTQAEFREMAVRAYNSTENAWKEKQKDGLVKHQNMILDINNTTAKKGETKVLTYFCDKRIPEISREIGIPLVVTSRYRKGDPGGHGYGRKCDIGLAGKTQAQIETIFLKIISNIECNSIGTSNKYLLDKYKNNPLYKDKIRDLRTYDANYTKMHPGTTMNHVNHFDISLRTEFGGSEQGK